MSRDRLLEGLKELGELCTRWQGSGWEKTHGFSQQGACNTWQVAALSLSMENKLKYPHSSLAVTRLVQTRFISSETKAYSVSYRIVDRNVFLQTPRRASFLEEA